MNPTAAHARQRVTPESFGAKVEVNIAGPRPVFDITLRSRLTAGLLVCVNVGVAVYALTQRFGYADVLLLYRAETVVAQESGCGSAHGRRGYSVLTAVEEETGGQARLG